MDVDEHSTGTAVSSSDKPVKLLFDYLDEDERESFGTVLRTLTEERVLSFVCYVRSLGHHSTSSHASHATPQQSNCKLLPNILCGSYHAVIVLEFSDGLRWALKVSAEGYKGPWNESLARSLTAEAQTMRLIRRETTMPVPDVYTFDASMSNGLGYPFILIEMLPGKPLYEGWYDDVSPAKLQQFRARALQGIAEAMSQLSKFAFDQGGSLLFDEDNHVSGTGPRRVLDHNEAYEHLCTRDPILHSLFSDAGPFKDVKTSFLSMLDQREGRRMKSTICSGAEHMLRLFIDWSHENDNDTQQQSFVLAHPDFGIQNILVAEDGTLTGIIDWDWVAAVPRSVGNQKLPDFLMRDYDPEDYNWDRKAGKSLDDHCETSPEELVWYRSMYAQYMEACSGKNESEGLMGDPEQNSKSRQAAIEAANLTRRSLVMGSLEKAANEQIPSLSIMIHLFEELEKLTAEKWEPDDVGSDSDTVGTSQDGGDDDHEDNDSDNDDEDEDEEDDESRKLRELLDEIDELTGMQAENDEILPLRSEDDDAEKPSGDDLPASAIAMGHQSRKRRFGRAICNWGEKKLRRAVQCLHKKKKPVLEARNVSHTPTAESGDSETGKVTPISVEAARTLSKWAQRVIQRAIEFLHSEGELKEGEASNLDAQKLHMGGLKALLGRLRQLFKRLMECLLRKNRNRNISPPTYEVPDPGLDAANDQAIVFNEVERRLAYDQIVRLLKLPGNPMVKGRQVIIAKWLLKSLQTEKPASELVKHWPGLATPAEIAKLSPDDRRRLMEGNQRGETSRKLLKKTPAASAKTEHGLVKPWHGQGTNSGLSHHSGDGDGEELKPTLSRSSEPDSEASGSVKIEVIDKIRPYPLSQRPSFITITRCPNQFEKLCGSDMGSIPITCDSEDDDEKSLGPSEDSDFQIIEDSHDVEKEETKDMNIKVVSGSSFHDSSTPLQTIPDLGQEAITLPDNKDKVPAIEEKDDPKCPGGFTMYEVCLALYYGNLDDRRMKRLKEGFLQLLNHT